MNPEPTHESRPHRTPPWWPEGEPWPPTGRPALQHWRNVRGRFLRRIGCALGLLFLFTSGILTALFWLTASLTGMFNLSASTMGVMRSAGIGLLFIGLVSAILALRGLRGTALPFGDLLEAVGRVADGDYSARVAERGPQYARRLARRFNKMAERLQTDDEQRRNLLAEVTHELRTPITVIQGNLEGILDGLYPADPEHITAILEETHVLSRLIDDLRTLSLAESGGLKLQIEEADIGEVMAEAAGSFQAQANQGGVDLRVEVQPGLPALELAPTRIREVLTNLLSNALRYTPSGGQVKLKACIAGSKPDHVRVSVEDTGAGIEADQLPNIFDRFFKTGDSHGTGLGLAIARGLVEAHGGEIFAESEAGRGTKIIFTLPIPDE